MARVSGKRPLKSTIALAGKAGLGKLHGPLLIVPPNQPVFTMQLTPDWKVQLMLKVLMKLLKLNRLLNEMLLKTFAKLRPTNMRRRSGRQLQGDTDHNEDEPDIAHESDIEDRNFMSPARCRRGLLSPEGEVCGDMPLSELRR